MRSDYIIWKYLFSIKQRNIHSAKHFSPLSALERSRSPISHFLPALFPAVGNHHLTFCPGTGLSCHLLQYYYMPTLWWLLSLSVALSGSSVIVAAIRMTYICSSGQPWVFGEGLHILSVMSKMLRLWATYICSNPALIPRMWSNLLLHAIIRCFMVLKTCPTVSQQPRHFVSPSGNVHGFQFLYLLSSVCSFLFCFAITILQSVKWYHL